MPSVIKGDSNVNLDFSTGGRITGDFSNATIANRVMFQTSTANSATSIYAIPSGTSSTSQFVAVNNSDPTNAGILQAQANSTEIQLRAGITGTGSYLPMTFYTGGSERMRIDTSGNVGIGTSSPTTGHTSGKTFAVAGSTDNSAPAATIMYGTSGAQGSGFYCVEVFALSGITSATEITRLTGTGANGFQAYIEITVTGHNSGIANGTVKKGYVYGGGTSTVTEISSVTNSTPPVISFDSSTSNVLIIKLASSNGTTEFKGVAKIEVLIPRDFSGNTWVVS